MHSTTLSTLNYALRTGGVGVDTKIIFINIYMGRRASGTGSVLTGQGGMNRAPNLPLDEMITLSEW